MDCECKVCDGTGELIELGDCPECNGLGHKYYDLEEFIKVDEEK
jgi:DnaJ-class molecular chaperone